MAGDPNRQTPSLLYAVKRLELVIRAHLDDLLRGSGVTTLQYTALTVLERRDGVTAAQLARDSFVTPQTMADMVRALEQRRLIRRAANPDNKRELLIYLTDGGRSFLAEFAGAVGALEDRMVSGFSPDQIEDFRTTLTTAWITMTSSRGRPELRRRGRRGR